MDIEHMHDNILSAMAQAVENSYIVLMCINQQYFDSGYCRLGRWSELISNDAGLNDRYDLLCRGRIRG